MDPRVVVLPGGPSLERARSLLRSMVNAPADLSQFGGVMVELMKVPTGNASLQADLLQPYLKTFKLESADGDYGFDERVMYEALVYTSQAFLMLWSTQVPLLDIRSYRFMRWIGPDLVLESA